MQNLKNKLHKYGLIPKPKWMVIGFAFMGLFPAFSFMAVSLLLPSYIIMYDVQFLFRGIASGEVWAFAMGCLAFHYYGKHLEEKKQLEANRNPHPT